MGLFNCWFLVARPLHLGVKVLDLQCEAEELNLMYSSPLVTTRRWAVEVCVPEGPPQEAPVVFGYIEVPCERYAPNIYRCIRT